MSTSSSKLSVTQDIDLPKLWIKPYYASFDGLRAVAVSLVFLCHYASFYRRDRLLFGLWGWVGVDLFFVLSGFLITGILYDSLHRPNYFRNFYVRRALRIFPIFYGFFLLLFLLTPALHLKWQWSVLSYFFYVGNLIVPFCDLRTNNPTLIMQAMPDHTLRYFCNIGYLWSLCVEEQFYLVWPAVIYFVRDRKTLLKICVGLIATTVIVRSAFRIHLDATINQHWLLFYWSTYFHSDGLLIGAFLALWLRTQKLSLRVLRRLSLWLFLVPAAIFFPGFLWTQFAHWDVYFLQNAFMNTVGLTLLGLSFGGLLLRSLDETGILSRFLQIKALRSLGTISYGFYFIHSLPAPFLDREAAAHPRWSPYLPVFAFIGTIVLATLSFHFYEAPFLKLKSRLAPGHKSVPSGNESLDPVGPI